jgi:hypothetical protein
MRHRGIACPLILLHCLALLTLSSACQPEGPASPDASATTPPRTQRDNQGVPAGRTANETFDEARARHHADPNSRHAGVAEDQTPEALAQEFSKLDLATLPAWPNTESLMRGFAGAKNDRFLTDPANDPGLRRRIPWQFPDDGCFTRAEAARDHLVQSGYPSPKKLFAFGSLSLDTPNAVGGTAFWWYHVAPTVRLGDEAFVLDPAVDSMRPLKISEWLSRMSADLSETRLTICDPTAYDAYSACLGSAPEYAQQEAEIDLPGLLQSEWDRLIELNRDPRAELGN